MNFLEFIFILFQFVIIIHLVFPFLLYILRAFKSKKKFEKIALDQEPDYAIIVTAFQQTTLLPMVVDSILRLNYSNYRVYVVADSCDISNLSFVDEKVVLLRPETELASNIKSHFYAIDHFSRAHKYLTIIDSDNLVHPEYLNELNLVFAHGYEAVQGTREAKNLNTQYACLDAAGDIYYRFVDRQLLFDAGSSASLSGSGMAFTTELYRSCLGHLTTTGAGFDKILQYEILSRKLKIAFAENAIVYDEKTSKSDQLVKQRARWINTWFKFFVLGLKLSYLSIINLNLNQFLFSIMLLRPPLFMLFITSSICILISVFVMPIASVIWVLAGLIFILMFFASLKYYKADKRIYDSLKQAPKFIFLQVFALLKANKANEISIATTHDQESSITNIKTN
ncbi:glycosyltransferase [Pedobacter fastidiosus]|uniref:Glycosyltransferase n=1 Tax=Pedobacter fastidiosus TaxID=2765361 RepID=A0ABR7KVI9_9SPHI|nr:glycosyltransferase [Pedobacter fastidiosus]MBC6112124.1 glycosyltransferase [Pedobacter fastidiosus]